MQLEELEERLARGEIVRLARSAWEEIEGEFIVREQHDTLVSGMLRIAERHGLMLAIEEPSPAERVLRPLADKAEADRFVKERLTTYERMWDGCGCKVDYYN